MKTFIFTHELFRAIEMKQYFRLFRLFVCMLMFLGVLVESVYAHKVNIFAYAEDGRIHAEGYFVDGSKCKNSLVEVIDEKSGEKLLEGHTNDNGQFVFDIPRVTSIKLILHAGTGHQNEYVLNAEEVKEALSKTAEKQKTIKTVQQSEEAVKKKLKNVGAANSQDEKNSMGGQHDIDTKSFTPQDLDEAIGRAMDKKLLPVIKILLALQKKIEKPGITEILGGIGYIIGILGIIAYFKERSKKL